MSKRCVVSCSRFPNRLSAVQIWKLLFDMDGIADSVIAIPGSETRYCPVVVNGKYGKLRFQFPDPVCDGRLVKKADQTDLRHK